MTVLTRLLAIVQPFRKDPQPLRKDPVWASLDRMEKAARKRHGRVAHLQSAKAARVRELLSWKPTTEPDRLREATHAELRGAG